MRQFCAFHNPNPATRAAIPLLLEVQSELIADLGTAVVVPLCAVHAFQGKPIKTLTPILEIDGKDYVMLTPQLAGVARKHIGQKVADLSHRRDAIIAALDLLITGI